MNKKFKPAFTVDITEAVTPGDVKAAFALAKTDKDAANTIAEYAISLYQQYLDYIAEYIFDQVVEVKNGTLVIKNPEQKEKVGFWKKIWRFLTGKK